MRHYSEVVDKSDLAQLSLKCGYNAVFSFNLSC